MMIAVQQIERRWQHPLTNTLARLNDCSRARPGKRLVLVLGDLNVSVGEECNEEVQAEKRDRGDEDAHHQSRIRRD